MLKPTTKFLRAVFVHTPKEHAMPHRPLEARYDDRLTEKLINDTNGLTDLSLGSLSDVSSKIIAPAGEAKGLVGIENDWDESRFGFIIEVAVNRGGKQVIEVYQGYTDFLGAQQSGTTAIVDQSMSLHIQTKSILSSSIVNRGGFNKRHLSTKSRINQVSERIITTADHNVSTTTSTIRPNDVLAAASTGVLRDADQFGDIMSTAESGTADTRTSIDSSGTPVDSRHLESNVYLQDVFTALSKASKKEDHLFDDEMVFADSLNYTRPPVNSNNEVLYILQNTYGNTMDSNCSFTWGQFISVFPELDAVAEFVFPKHGHIEDMRDYNNSLSGSTKHAQIAYMLGHILPTLMFNNKCGSFNGTVTNVGLNVTSPVATLKSFQSIYVTDTDNSEYVRSIINSLENEIIRLVVDVEIFDFSITFHSTLGGGSRITIDLFDGNGQEPFRVPNYCSAIALPLVSTDTGNELNKVTTGLRGAFEAITKRCVDSPIITPGHGLYDF